MTLQTRSKITSFALSQYNDEDNTVSTQTLHAPLPSGMGRNSSRVARRRIANTNTPADEDTLDEEDADLWASKPKRPKVKRNG